MVTAAKLEIFLDHSNSSADIFVILDDDSCLLDNIRYSDIISDNKLRVRGLARVTRYNSLNVYERAISYGLDLEPIGHFMTDFPLPIWRDMLPDLRDWLVKLALNETLDTRAPVNDQISTVREAMLAIDKRGHYGAFSEFNVIYHFAYYSTKWHHRYDWLIAPNRVAVGLSTHEHKVGCPATWVSRSLPVVGTLSPQGQLFNKTSDTISPYEYMYYPANLRIRTHARGVARVEWDLERTNHIIALRDSNRVYFDVEKELNCKELNSHAECWAKIFYGRESTPKPTTVIEKFPNISTQWRACFAQTNVK